MCFCRQLKIGRFLVHTVRCWCTRRTTQWTFSRNMAFMKMLFSTACLSMYRFKKLWLNPLLTDYYCGVLGQFTWNTIMRNYFFEDREKRLTWEHTELCGYITKKNAPINLEPTCEWIDGGGILQRLCSHDFTVPVRVVGGGAEPFVRLFDKFFNIVISKKIEIALFCLICWFGMVGN